VDAKHADSLPSQIYTFRLLIEYARIIDDNRDRIGYSGDGSELARYDSQHPMDDVLYVQNDA
jgi:hypothetical protein